MNFIPKNPNKLGSNRMFQQCPRYLCGIELNHCDAASPKYFKFENSLHSWTERTYGERNTGYKMV